VSVGGTATDAGRVKNWNEVGKVANRYISQQGVGGKNTAVTRCKWLRSTLVVSEGKKIRERGESGEGGNRPKSKLIGESPCCGKQGLTSRAALF